MCQIHVRSLLSNRMVMIIKGEGWGEREVCIIGVYIGGWDGDRRKVCKLKTIVIYS